MVRVAAFEDIRAAKPALEGKQDAAAEAELTWVSRMLARGEHPGFDLEQFVARMAKEASSERKLSGHTLEWRIRLMAEDDATHHELAARFIARMASQIDSIAHGRARYEMLGRGISGASTCRVRFDDLIAVLKFTVQSNGEAAIERANRELAFYRHLAERVPVQVPQLLASYGGPEGIALLLPLYEPSPTPGRWPAAGYLEASRQMAQLHAAFWGKTGNLERFTWLKRRNPGDLSKEITDATRYWQSLRDRPQFANVLDSHTFDWITGLLSRYETIAVGMPVMPPTLCHGDSNTTNVLRDAEGRFVWADWQEVGPARGPEDISFFIQRASVEADIPREQMLAEYSSELRRAIGEQVSLDDVRLVVEAADLQSYLLYWPAYLTQADEARLRDLVERIRSLARGL